MTPYIIIIRAKGCFLCGGCSLCNSFKCSTGPAFKKCKIYIKNLVKTKQKSQVRHSKRGHKSMLQTHTFNAKYRKHFFSVRVTNCGIVACLCVECI